MEQPPGLGKSEWTEKLSQIGAQSSAQLCLIGSAACIFSGMESRTSIDLDVWRPSSKFDEKSLQNAVESAGLLYNPTHEALDRPYIQVVEPGICQTGTFDKSETMMEAGSLTVTRPPIANLIASKLVRCEARDLEDIAYLLTKYQPDPDQIQQAVESMPRIPREKASENLVYLEILNPSLET